MPRSLLPDPLRQPDREIVLQFFQPVLTVAAGTVDLAIQPLGTMPEVGDHDARVVPKVAARVDDDFGLDHRTARVRPRLRLIAGLAKTRADAPVASAWVLDELPWVARLATPWAMAARRKKLKARMKGQSV